MNKIPFNLVMNLGTMPMPFGILPGVGLWEVAAVLCGYFLVCSFAHYLQAYKVKQELAALKRCNFSHLPVPFQWEKALSATLHR